jgi:CBS domain-containing protein
MALLLVEDTLDRIIDLLTEPGYVPVVDETGAFVGMVFSEDLLLHYRQALRKKMIGLEYGTVS